jgi:hypothetical protein
MQMKLCCWDNMAVCPIPIPYSVVYMNYKPLQKLKHI